MRRNGMNAAGPGLPLVVQCGGEARPKIAPPLSHDIGNRAPFIGSASTVLVCHTSLTQPLQALHTLVGQNLRHSPPVGSAGLR